MVSEKAFHASNDKVISYTSEAIGPTVDWLVTFVTLFVTQRLTKGPHMLGIIISANSDNMFSITKKAQRKSYGFLLGLNKPVALVDSLNSFPEARMSVQQLRNSRRPRILRRSQEIADSRSEVASST